MSFYSHTDGVFITTGGGLDECLKPRGIKHVVEINPTTNQSRIVTEFGETTCWKDLETYSHYIKKGVWVEIPYPEDFIEPED